MRSHRRAEGYARTRNGGFITGTVDTRDVDRLLRELSQGKEGRKLIRNASRVALEIFNEETAKNAKELNVVPSGKQWRKTLQKKGSYKYRAQMSKGRFHFWSGISYKGILKVSHLVERGFKHVSGKFIPGQWFRMRAYEQNRAKVMRMFKSYMERGMDIIASSGKAPSLKNLRNLTR